MAFFLWLHRVRVFPHFLAILREQPSASSFKVLCEMGTQMQDSSSNKIHVFLGCAVGAKPDPTTAITSHQCTQALQKCSLKVCVNNKFNGEKKMNFRAVLGREHFLRNQGHPGFGCLHRTNLWSREYSLCPVPAALFLSLTVFLQHQSQETHCVPLDDTRPCEPGLEGYFSQP